MILFLAMGCNAIAAALLMALCRSAAVSDRRERARRDEFSAVPRRPYETPTITPLGSFDEITKGQR